MIPQRLRCEHLDTPLGIDVLAPRLSWELVAEGWDHRQTAYRILAASRRELLAGETPDLWDSGRVASDATTHIAWDGKPLGDAQAVWWTVMVWDEAGVASAWAEPARFETGLFSGFGSASWLTAASRPHTADGGRACPHLRAELALRGDVVRARAYVSALGVYELWCNGARAGDERFLPGWTDYRHRIPYAVHDVTALLHDDRNAVGIVLGDGWYCGYLGFTGNRDAYGEEPAVCALIVVDYADGSRETFATDATWRVAFGALLASDMQMGETYDARRELTGWAEAGYDDASWHGAAVVATPSAPLRARVCEPVRVTEELRPVSVRRTGEDSHLVDFGQNIAGWARLRVHDVPQGTPIRLRFAEMLDADGALYTENYGRARCTDTYIARGDAVEEWEPSFTFRGFRYVEVRGHRTDFDAAQITARVAHTDLTVTGGFECSDERLNRLQANIAWSQRANFLEVPTDCPQRDERLGWMGDAHIFAPTATFNMDVAAFFTKWLQDVRDAQRDDGAYADIAPEAPGVSMSASSPAWADAGVIVPWVMWQRYADRALLAQHYESMCRYVDHLARNNEDHIWHEARGRDYGDWLSIDADTPKVVLATAFFARSAQLLARIAEVLGHAPDAARYTELADNVRRAFIDVFVDAEGRVVGDTQAAYVLALRFGLIPDALRAAVAARLVADIEAHGDHLTTGFVSTAHILPVLTETGHLDVAWRLLMQDTFPSWLCCVKNGATSMWERWDGWTPENGFQNPQMNSFNHYAFGCAGEWMYDVIGGIAPDPSAPGFRRVIVHPRPGGGVTWARAWHRTPHGTVRTSWRLEGTKLVLDLEVPVNTEARVLLPDGDVRNVGSGTHHFEAVAQVWQSQSRQKPDLLRR